MPRGRKTAIRLPLPAADRLVLERWHRSTTIAAGLAKRARMLLLIADGLPLSQVATRVGIGRHKLYLWLRRYQAQGLQGLQDARQDPHRPRTRRAGGGRPKRFQFAQGALVAWACAPHHQPWVVCWQRITYRGGESPLVEYSLRRVRQPGAPVYWVPEPDLLPWEARPCPS